jgi:hypothetical protein
MARGGKGYVKYCADAVWGDRERALVAAQHLRDRLLLVIGPDSRVRRRQARGGKGGVPGVSLERHVVDGRVYERYVACWQDLEKGLQRRRFLVGRYGKEQALELAREAREAGVARYHALLLARQRREAKERLRAAPKTPRRVKDPLSRKGISMARRRRVR